jgi:hypothetical protein
MLLVTRAGEPATEVVEQRRLALDSGRFIAPRFVDGENRDAQLDRLVAVGVVDVRIHLERLDRAIERRDAEGVYGALVDLFIATDERAVEVRRRALHWAAGLLHPSVQQFLSAHLAAGLERNQPMPVARRSMFSAGIVGATRLVTPVVA